MTIRSVDNLALWAADNATGNASGCMTSKEAFVACIWYVSSAGVKEGFAPLPNDNQCSDLYDQLSSNSRHDCTQPVGSPNDHQIVCAYSEHFTRSWRTPQKHTKMVWTEYKNYDSGMNSVQK